MEIDKNLENLLKKTDYLSDIDNKIKEISEAFKEMKTLIDQHPNGVGLSSIQIGGNLPIIIIRINNYYYYYINPIYGPAYKTTIKNIVEGCLSLPDILCNVPRFKNIQLSGFKFNLDDATYKPIDETRSGLHAYAFQHEVDHLHGITILHKANFLMPAQDKKIKSVYKVESKDDFIIEGLDTTIFKKETINKEELKHNYIVGYYENSN